MNIIGKSMWQKFLDGEIKRKEYKDYTTRKMGFKDFNDYNRDYLHKAGISNPMYINKKCTLYLGVHIAERILPVIFKNAEQMPINNIGYDFVCSNKHKIDVKSSCLCGRNMNQWQFEIDQNMIADYFLLIAFNNRSNLKLMYTWLINKNSIIRGRMFNQFIKFTVTSGYTSDIDKYELYMNKNWSG